MTTNVTICYSTTAVYPEDQSGALDWNDTLSEVLNAWAAYGVPGTHPGNTGGFFTDGVNSGNLYGDTYAFNIGGNYAFSVSGELDYYFYPLNPDVEVPGAINHTLYGSIEKISFGGGLDTDGTVLNPFLTICFDDPLTSELLDGWAAGTVHDVIYGLMNANVQPLLDVLDDLGVDVDDTIASLGDEFPNCDCDSTLVGIPEFDDYLLAA